MRAAGLPRHQGEPRYQLAHVACGDAGRACVQQATQGHARGVSRPLRHGRTSGSGRNTGGTCMSPPRTKSEIATEDKKAWEFVWALKLLSGVRRDADGK